VSVEADAPMLAAVAAVAFLGSVVGGVTGYGTGLLLPPVLAPVVGVVAVVPVMSVAMAFTNGSRIWVYRRDVDRRVVRLTAPLALLGTAIGAWVYVQLPEAVIALALGGFLLLAVPLQRYGAARRFALGDAGLAASGFGYGLLAGGMSGTGLLFIVALRAAGIGGSALVATDATVALSLGLLKTAIFWSNGLLDGALLLAGLAIGLCAFPGAFVARAVMSRLQLRHHDKVMEAVIVIGGLSLIWKGLSL